MAPDPAHKLSATEMFHAFRLTIVALCASLGRVQRGMRTSRCLRFATVVLAFSGLTAAVSQASPACPLTLAWDAPSNPAVLGYVFHYGLTGSSVTNRLETGSVRQVTLSHLQAGSNYFFYVTAYDANGIEGDPSDLLLLTASIVSPLQGVALPDGAMRIQFSSLPGTVCRVEHAAPSLSPRWETLGTTTADSVGNIQIDDPPAGRPAIRFYRAVAP